MHRSILILAIIAASAAEIAHEKTTSTTLPREPIIDVELDELAFKIDRNAKFIFDNAPESIRKLHGRRIRLHGYMFPTFEETGLTDFILNGETKQRASNFTNGLNRVPIHFYIPVTLRPGTSQTIYSR
jgi:hypothetical protein